MSTMTPMVGTTDPDTMALYRAGGISGVALGISYLVIIAMYVVVGPPPGEVEPWLKYLAAHRTAWWAILGLSVLTDLLFVPVVAALYLALRHVRRNAMVAGACLVLAFVILDLAVTWPNYASAIILGGKYAAATSAAQQAALLAAAHYASAVLTSTLFGVYAVLVPSLGILTIGLVMLRGPFGKPTAYSAVGSGILGIVAMVGPFFTPALGLAIVVGSALTTAWVLLAGVRLHGLGRAGL